VQLEQADAGASTKIVGQLPRNVENKNGLDVDAVAELLKEARRVIIEARAALF
jgi:hypothetical protein